MSTKKADNASSKPKERSTNTVLGSPQGSPWQQTNPRKIGPSLSFGAKLFTRDINKMADEMEVEAASSTAATSSKTSKDEAMEVDLPQKENVPTKGSSGPSTSSTKHSKGFELPW